MLCTCGAAQISLNLALVKNATLHGVFWGSYMQHQPRVLRQSLEELLAWLGAGRISVPIFHRRVPYRVTCLPTGGREEGLLGWLGAGRTLVPIFQRRVL